MKHFLSITAFSLTIALCASSQGQKNWLYQKIKMADSVVLVSHEITAGLKIIDKSGKDIQLPALTIAGKPNYKIIKERQTITGSQLDSLIKILNRPFEDKRIETGKCFIPHHAIFLIKNEKTSYIDICFNCLRIETSKDLQRLYTFDNRKWREMHQYFVRLGFKYELTND